MLFSHFNTKLNCLIVCFCLPSINILKNFNFPESIPNLFKRDCCASYMDDS